MSAMTYEEALMVVRQEALVSAVKIITEGTVPQYSISDIEMVGNITIELAEMFQNYIIHGKVGVNTNA